MRKDIKDRWLKALRGGDYSQGHRTLQRGGKYCCLGVLCDIAVDDGVGTWQGNDQLYFVDDGEVFDEEEDYYISESFNNRGVSKSSITRGVMKWAEIDEWRGFDVKIKVGADLFLLTWLNDSNTTFEEIANIIEREL